MSSSFGDDLPPRRAGPRPKSKPKATNPGGTIPEGGNTWRPADGPSAEIPRPGKPRPKRSADPRDVMEPVTESSGPTLIERLLFGRVGTAHLAKFCRQFSAYQEAGV